MKSIMVEMICRFIVHQALKMLHDEILNNGENKRITSKNKFWSLRVILNFLKGLVSTKLTQISQQK